MFDTATPAETPADIVRRIGEAARVVRTPAGDGDMVWRLWGAGPAVLLLHGGHGSWMHWVRNVPALAERFTVIAPDMPGFGESALPPEPPGPQTIAGETARGLDAVLGSRAPFAIVGFSYGTTIGALVARAAAERVRSFVLVGAGSSSLGLPAPELAPLRRWRAATAPAALAACHRHNLAVLMFAEAANIDDLAVHIQTENGLRVRVDSRRIRPKGLLRDTLAEVRAPVTAVWGGADAFTRDWPREREALVRGACPDCEIHVIEGAGHWVMYEAAAATNALLIETLGGQGP